MAFNNVIGLAEQFLPILDEVYKRDSITSVLDAANGNVKFTGGNKVELFEMAMNGLGDYSRNAGYVDGNVTGTWQPYTLEQDRGRRFICDTMDNEESLAQTFGNMASQFIKQRVAPEIDAYRFAKYSAAAGNTASADITVGTTDVADLIDAAEQTMSDKEVPVDGKILFVSETAYRGLKNNITREWTNEGGIEREVMTFDGKRVIRVPKARFNTGVTLLDGTTSGETDGGFKVPRTTTYGINFMLVHPSAVLQVAKHVAPKIVTPEANQFADGWLFAYRIYHDCFVLNKKTDGIYVHKTSTANASDIVG